VELALLAADCTLGGATHRKVARHADRADRLTSSIGEWCDAEQHRNRLSVAAQHLALAQGGGHTDGFECLHCIGGGGERGLFAFEFGRLVEIPDRLESDHL